MIKRIREKFDAARGKKRCKFDDLAPIVERCFREYAHLFPKRSINKDGSRVVYHANVGDLQPVSLEKEHGSREFLPPRYAKFALAGIDDLISYIESHPDGERGRTESQVAGDPDVSDELGSKAGNGD
jgi:hypothetical protein